MKQIGCSSDLLGHALKKVLSLANLFRKLTVTLARQLLQMAKTHGQHGQSLTCAIVQIAGNSAPLFVLKL